MAMIRWARQWWTHSNQQLLLESQDKLLKALVKSPRASTNSSSILNSVEYVVGSSLQQQLPTVVLAHGFGSGLGFFYHNIDALLNSGKIGRVILVDWLGMGGSERPACHRRPMRGWTDWSTSLCDSRFTPSQAVDFFIDPLDAWLQQVVAEDEPVWLVGHSLGGYLAARYVDKYGRRISKLVLASPVGFPSKPDNALSGSQLSTSLRLVDALWSSNLTPQQLVRLMGATRGRRNVERALVGRIPHLQGQQATTDNSSPIQLLADYLYHITVAHPSGEFAMNSLLEPVVSPDTMGVYAREPLESLWKNIKHSQLENVQQVKVLYGENDWMRPNETSARRTLELLQNDTAAEASVEILPQAGHHLYLDNPDGFVRHILE